MTTSVRPSCMIPDIGLEGMMVERTKENGGERGRQPLPGGATSTSTSTSPSPIIRARSPDAVFPTAYPTPSPSPTRSHAITPSPTGSPTRIPTIRLPYDTTFARERRSPPVALLPTMNIQTTVDEHVLDVVLPQEIRSDMITVSAKKGDRLDIVADLWHREENSHYEWEIDFPPRDVDMNSIRIFLTGGHLTIHARRVRASPPKGYVL